jgi:hypothetical protein
LTPSINGRGFSIGSQYTSQVLYLVLYVSYVFPVDLCEAPTEGYSQVSLEFSGHFGQTNTVLASASPLLLKKGSMYICPKNCIPRSHSNINIYTVYIYIFPLLRYTNTVFTVRDNAHSIINAPFCYSMMWFIFNLQRKVNNKKLRQKYTYTQWIMS